MTNLKRELHKLTKKWRLAGKQTRGVAVEITNLLARGHLQGMSDGLDVAADDVETLLDKSDLLSDPTHDVEGGGARLPRHRASAAHR